MRSTITLLIGLSTLLLFISIQSISYVNAQSALNTVSLDNKSSNVNSAVESDNLDPFTLRESSNDASTVNNNDQLPMQMVDRQLAVAVTIIMMRQLAVAVTMMMMRQLAVAVTIIRIVN